MTIREALELGTELLCCIFVFYHHIYNWQLMSCRRVLEAVQNGPHAHQITPLYLVIGTVENSHRGSGKVSRDASGGTGASALSTWGSAVEQGSVVARVQAVVPEDKMDGK